MKSIKELYRIGTGPSSSHTMGPRKAAEMFLERHPDAASFKVTLYGSLAATGKGHMTDVAIIDTLQPVAPVEIVWQPKVFLPFHPNGMTFAALDANNKVTENWTVYSIGGGALAENNDTPTIESPEVYGMNNMTEILQWCERTGKSYWEYVKECENEDIWDYLAEVWTTMKDTLFDEKIMGSFHFTPGNCYEEAPNGNASSIHWDLVCIQRPEYGGGEIWFDGVLIRKDGRFVIPELECLNPENLIS